jgi:hypothetical protein
VNGKAKYPTIKAGILALLREDGAAWTVAEIDDWFERNPNWCGIPGDGTVRTYLLTLAQVGAVARFVGSDGQVRFRHQE